MNGPNARVLAAAVQALAAVGKEVTFAVEHGKCLVLSAMPEAQAAFGQVRFEATCFSKCRVGSLDLRRLGCKVVARSLMPALRRATAKASTGGVSGVYKLIIRHELPRKRNNGNRGEEEAYFSEDDDDDDEDDDDDDASAQEHDLSPRLTLEVWHEDGVRRRWRLFYEAAETVFVPEFEISGAGEIVCQPLQFLGIFEHVGAAGLDLRISKTDGMAIASHDDDDTKKKSGFFGGPSFGKDASQKGLRSASTHLRIDRSDLDACDLPASCDDDVCLSFQAKEVKAFVKFCEHSGVSQLRLRFSAKLGRPIALEADAPSGAKISFLVSTSASRPRAFDEHHTSHKAPLTSDHHNRTGGSSHNTR